MTIMPPRVEVVIEKRLLFAQQLAQGNIPFENMTNVTIRLENISLFLLVLYNSLKENNDLRELLANITGGNVRTAIEFVTKFIGSPNINAEKIIEIMKKEGGYLIPLHESQNQHYWVITLIIIQNLLLQ